MPGSKTLMLWGTIPQDATGENIGFAIEDPSEYAAQAFRAMLEKRGITIGGKASVQHTLTASLPLPPDDTSTLVAALPPGSKGGGQEPATAPSPAPSRAVLAFRDSEPFAVDARVINKVSQNLHAELTLRQIGLGRATVPSLEGALAVEKQFLLGVGIQPEEFRLYDGSGMSQLNLVTPHAVTRLLSYAYAQPWGALFRSTLPVAGQDGSLGSRFVNTFAEQRVFAKTGTLSHTNALSGYAQTLTGEWVVFSIFA